ncbi:MAG: HAD-IA family hydrolase [Candidatus Saccharibacteria bacterium]
MSKYELLILDYGGVYSFEFTHADVDRLRTTVFGRIPTDEEVALIAPIEKRLARNDISSQEYVGYVADIMSVAVPSVELFERTVLSVTHPPSAAMVKLREKVSAAGIKTVILSNMFLFEMVMTKPQGRYEGFDFTDFSCAAGLTKSETKFFQITLDHFGVAADKALFVDDMLANTQTARVLGIHTIHADKLAFGSAEQLAEAIAVELFSQTD